MLKELNKNTSEEQRNVWQLYLTTYHNKGIEII